MTYVRRGFLVEEYGGAVQRKARLVEAPPEGKVQLEGTTWIGGEQYVLAFHFPDGINQGRAVAWPKGTQR